MATVTRIVGSYLSPYVRKVLACLHLKGVPYEVDPIVPFFGDDAFTRISPLRRIPVLIDDQVTIADSTVICEYLDERHPGPRLYPQGAARRARARWLEEYADSRLGEVIVWRFFNQVAIRRFVWNEAADEAVVQRARDVEIPQILDDLERELPATGWLFDDIGVPDIAIAAFFRNAAFARYEIDAARWPRSAAFVARALAHPALASLQPREALTMRTPLAQQRAALIAAGAPICAQTFGTAEPRRGVMTI